MTESGEPRPLTDAVTDDGVFEVVADGYEAVYQALSASETFNRIWRSRAYNGEFPADFAHIGFLTLDEASTVRDVLALGEDSTLVDLACGSGGPGLWMASQTGASLIGVDPTESGLALARDRAQRVGLGHRAEFRRGTFARTGLSDSDADAVMSIEAFQYAPDKAAGLAEIRRILRPGGRVAFVAFEVDPAKALGVPVLGVDPVRDYRPLLEAAGFQLDTYDETPRWEERVYGVFQAIVDSADTLTAEMGERAAAAVIAEAMITLSARPYPRRVLAAASGAA
jgi:SAM-dependent methyltransferase